MRWQQPKIDSDVQPNVDAPFDSSHVSANLERQQSNNVGKKKAPINKRLLRLLYILCFAVYLMASASCSSGVTYRPIQSPALETAAPTASEEPSVSIEEQVLLDRQDIKITALSIIENTDGTAMHIQIENRGANEVTVSLWHVLVNGMSVHKNFMNCVVKSGETATADISLFAYYVISIREVELGSRIHDNVTLTDTDSDTVTIKTIAAETTTQTDETDDSAALGKNGVIYKQGGITIYVGSYQAPSSYDDAPAFELGIANDSDNEVNAYFRNFIINGHAIESAWLDFDHTSAGNAWSEFMSFYPFASDELAYLGITAFETVDFQLRVQISDGISDKIQIYNVSLSIPKSNGDEYEFVYPDIVAVTEDVDAEARTSTFSIVEPFVIGDQNGIKLTAVSLDTTDIDLSHSSTALNLLLENKTDEDLTCKTSYVSVNGVMVDAYFALPLLDHDYFPHVPSGEQRSCSIEILNDSLISAGIQTIKDIEFSIDLQPIFNGTVQKKYSLNATLSTTVPASFVQVLDDSGTVLLDRDGVKVIAQGLHKDFDNDTSFLKLYIENYSDHTVDFTALDVAINGEEIQPRTKTLVVYPGKVTYGRIEFGLEELDAGDSIAFRLQTCDTDTSEVMFETDALTLTFPE